MLFEFEAHISVTSDNKIVASTTCLIEKYNTCFSFLVIKAFVFEREDKCLLLKI